MAGVAALLLAAGEGRRMGGPNKLLAELGGRSLVRRAAEAALASRARPVVAVTGHQGDRIAEALQGLDLRIESNPDYADGLSTSLRRGLAALPPEAEGVLVLLADMPFVTASVLDRLIAAFESEARPPIVVPTAGGRRGNPVLWPRRFFPELLMLEGDVGARQLLQLHAEAVQFVEVGQAAAIDLDTPEALAEAGGRLAD